MLPGELLLMAKVYHTYVLSADNLCLLRGDSGLSLTVPHFDGIQVKNQTDIAMIKVWCLNKVCVCLVELMTLSTAKLPFLTL